MANRPKNKMPIEERAKQFMPFAAVKGLPEALAAKEKITVDKFTLTEDIAEELNQKIMQLKPGAIISVVYFHNHEYIKITGKLAKINTASRLLQIVDKKISFDDIYDVTWIRD